MNVIVSNKCQVLLANLNIDVIKNINGVFSTDDLVGQFKNFFYNKMILDITALEDYENINTIQKLSVSLDMSKVILLLDDSPKVNSAMFLSQLVSMGIYNFTKNIDAVAFLIDNPNSYKDVASFHQLNMTQTTNTNTKKQNNEDSFIGQRVLGVKNLTPHAGATTLTFLLKKHLAKSYKVKAIEIGDSDFKYFNDQDLLSATTFELKEIMGRHEGIEVIILSIPENGEGEELCTDIIYLVEPGLIQLNRLIDQDSQIFEKLKGKKMVLNRSILTQNDVADFERESGSKVFYNVPNVDDKLDDIKQIKELLGSLGFTRVSEGVTSSKKGFSLFK